MIVFFWHHNLVAYVFVSFGLVMAFSVLSQAASQGNSVDPNITKYSVKVLPVSNSWACAHQFNSWIQIFLLSRWWIVFPAVQLWSELVWISGIFQEAWFQVFWNKLILSIEICDVRTSRDLTWRHSLSELNCGALLMSFLVQGMPAMYSC